MNLFKNPFYILGATPQDNKYRMIELAEERSLLSDADECMEAKDILITPRRRVSAEVTWLPGVDPSFYGLLFRYLESPNEELPNITMAPIASANLRATKLSRYADLLSSDILEWTLEITQKSEAIQPEEVREVLNDDRSVARFPEAATSDVDNEIRNQKIYYSETVTSVLENLSVNDRARTMTSLLETATSNGRYQSPTLIRDLIPAYELSVQDSLEQHNRIIEAQDEALRTMADARNPDTTLSPIVDQLLESLREWDTLAQPIQLSRQSTGQRHDASFEMARRLRLLAADLFIEYRRPDFSRRILNTLTDVFSEMPEIVEQIVEDSNALEEQARLVESMEEFENINAQVEQLTAASDARQPDYTLTPMVNRLIQTVRSWNPSTQLVEANNAVAIIVRNIALHLWNEHQRLDFAIQITETLIEVFRGVDGMDEVNNRLNEDIITLYAMDAQRRQAIEQQQQRGGTGCLLQIVIFAVLALIGSLLQGC